MDNSLLKQMVDNQSTMLQQMQNMQMQQSINMHQQTPVMTPNFFAMPPAMDPAHSSVFSNVQMAMGQGINFNQPSSSQGAFYQMLGNAMHFEPMFFSPQARTEFAASQSRLMNEGIMQAIGTFNNVAGFAAGFIPGPGMLSSLLMGGAAGATVGVLGDAFVDSMRRSADYEDLLSRKSYKFINPFESINEYGASGFKRKEIQEATAFLRGIGIEKFIDDKDVQQILTGSIDNKLLKSVSDVESFKKKFSSIIDTVKKVTLTMDQTIDEAIKFMGEMERRGVSLEDTGRASAAISMAGRMSGMSGGQMFEKLIPASDQMVQNTSIKSSSAIQSLSENVSIVQMMAEKVKKDDPAMYTFLKNSGGAEQFAINFTQNLNNFLQKTPEQSLALIAPALERDASGRFRINTTKLEQMANSGATYDQLVAGGLSQLNALTNGSPELQQRLLSELPSLLGGLTATNMNDLIGMNIKGYFTGMPAGSENTVEGIAQALLRARVVTNNDEAMMYAKMLKDSEAYAPFVRAKTFMADINAAYTSQDPTTFQKITKSYREMKNNIFGDAAQSTLDTVSNAMINLSNQIQGISDRSTAGYAFEFKGTNLQNDPNALLFTEERLAEASRTARELEEKYPYKTVDPKLTREQPLSVKIMNDINASNSEIWARDAQAKGKNLGLETQFSNNLSLSETMRIASRAEAGDYSPNEIEAMRQRMLSTPDGIERSRLQYIMNRYEKRYDDSFGGTIKQFFDEMDLGLQDASDPRKSANVFANYMDELFGTDDLSGEEQRDNLKAMGDRITASSADLDKEVRRLTNSGKFKDLNRDAIAKAIREGRVEDVKRLTTTSEAQNGNQEAIKLAQRHAELKVDRDKYDSTVGYLTNLSSDVESKAKALQGSKALISQISGMSEEDVENFYGDDLEQAEEILGDLSSYNNIDLEKAQKDLETRLSRIFNLPSIDKQKLIEKAEEIYGKGNLPVSQSRLESTDANIRQEAFVELAMKILAANQSGQKDVDAAVANNSGNASKALDENSNVMYKVAQVVSENTRMLKQGLNGEQVSPPSQNTTLQPANTETGVSQSVYNWAKNLF